MKKIKQLIPDALAIAGALLIWHGIDLIYKPAGFIAAGSLMFLAAVIWSKGGGGE